MFMMTTTKIADVFQYLDTLAPMERKLDFDNVGLLLGSMDQSVGRILLALDITDEVIDEAIQTQADLIISHHPLIFSPLKAVVESDMVGRKVLRLAQHGIGVICMHTNLDLAPEGVNDVLAFALGLSEVKILEQIAMHDGAAYGLGRYGQLAAEESMHSFLPFVKERLHTKGLRYHDAGRPVSRVAVMGGSGGDCLANVTACDCDTYVVGEVKYHHFLEAKERNINLIEADHFCTEHLVLAPFGRSLEHEFPNLRVRVSEWHKQVAHFFV